MSTVPHPTPSLHQPFSLHRHLARVSSIVLVLIVMSAASVAHAQGAATEQKLSRDWKRLSSSWVEAAGNASDDDMRRVVTELDAFRWAFVRMFPSVRLTSPVPTTVFVFKDWEAFTKYQPRDAAGRRQENVGGYFLPAPDRNYMVMGAPGGSDEYARMVVLHEFTHYIVHRNVTDIPLWLDEGLAEYYATLKIDKDRIVIGLPPTHRLKVLRTTTLLPLEQMLSAQASAKLFKDTTFTERFYAQSWALVHYLTLGGRGKRQGQAGAYVAGLQRGLTVEAAFKGAFGCGFDDLEKELRTYVDAFQFPMLGVPMTAGVLADPGKPERMTETDADVVQADLLVRAGARDDAEKKLTSVFSRDPALASARLSLALLRLQQERREEAITVLQELAKADEKNFAAFGYLSAALMDGGRHEEARQAAERVTALRPDVPSAWAALSLTALAADRQAQADEAAERFMRLEPDKTHFRDRAFLAFRLGKDGAAARDAQTFVTRAGWGHESSPYVVFAAALAYRRLGQPAEAEKMLAQVRSSVEAGSWTEKVLQFLEGKLDATAFLQKARENGEKTEAHTYIGYQDALAGRRADAMTHFRWVKSNGAKNYIEHGFALAELERMEKAEKGAAGK